MNKYIYDALDGGLADIYEQAENMFFQLVEQMVKRENITEELTTENIMLWVRRIKEIRTRARKIANAE